MSLLLLHTSQEEEEEEGAQPSTAFSFSFFLVITLPMSFTDCVLAFSVLKTDRYIIPAWDIKRVKNTAIIGLSVTPCTYKIVSLFSQRSSFYELSLLVHA